MVKIVINGAGGHRVTDDPAPTLSIQKPGERAAVDMELTVTDDNGEVFWESGRREYTPHIRYGGKTLHPKRSYMVSAVLSDGSGVNAEGRGSFETGFLGTPWSAGWIEPEQENGIREKEIPFSELFTPNPDFFGGHERLRPCREIRKLIRLESPPVRGRIYASSHGIYTLSVNGTRAEGNLFSPGTSAYSHLLYYQTFDIGELLTEGDNEIRAVLADGWWIGRIGISGDSCQYGNRLGFIMEADIACEDGTRITVPSDETFQCRRSCIDYADLFIGQRTDFTRHDDEWKACSTVVTDTSNLTAQPVDTVEVYEKYEPRWSVSPAGELIGDFGQCIAGVVDITVECESGREVTLDFCEVLDKEGNFLRNILGRNKDQRDVFVTGTGTTCFTPRFTYHGFRYVRISGCVREEVTGMSALAMGTRIRSRGSFTCSDERLNRLQENIRRSTRANMFFVPTDCPQREKAGWTGDIAVFAPTGCFNYYLDGFLSAWLANMRLEQFDSGEVPVVVPDYPMQEKMQSAMGGSSSSVWSDACIMVPWYIYRSYGDIRVLRDNVDMMRRWLAFVEEQCRREPPDPDNRSDREIYWNDYLFNKGYHFGDWFIPSFIRREGGVFQATAATRDVTGSSYHAVALATYIKVLTTLRDHEKTGDNYDIEIGHNRKRLESVRQAVRECYVDETMGRVRGDLQGLYVIVLLSGAVDGELKKKLVSRLAALIEENGNRLDTGFVSTPHLLDVFADNGRMDCALSLLFQTGSPSWLYMVENGATTIWENWEAIRPDGTPMASSFNHYALGSVGSFLYRRIGGIEIGEPGYRTIIFSPVIHCGLDSAHAELETPYGTVSCGWEWKEGECEVILKVPRGCGAVLTAGGRDETVPAGSHTYIFT